MDLTKITFRNAQNNNEDFLLLRNIHREAMFDSVVKTIGEWNDEFQKSRLEKHFKEAYSTLLFIEYNGNVIPLVPSKVKPIIFSITCFEVKSELILAVKSSFYHAVIDDLFVSAYLGSRTAGKEDNIPVFLSKMLNQWVSNRIFI